ncbi:MAG: hypothetical protein IIU82_00835 [Tidjanibacter sp.]|nr:hypothetical protein [Tidjanibacter sp.]
MAKHPVVVSLTEKVGRLIEQNVRLERECADLIEQRDKVKRENRRLQKEMQQMEHRLSLLEMGNGMSGNDKEVKRARQQINRLVREIDRCIALMNK